jgi:hypothetical protein
MHVSVQHAETVSLIGQYYQFTFTECIPGWTGRHSPVPVLVESLSCSASAVVCGQNCTYVVTTGGLVMACGEGSYGRLSHGNNVYSPSLVTALQGNLILFNEIGLKLLVNL